MNWFQQLWSKILALDNDILIQEIKILQDTNKINLESIEYLEDKAEQLNKSLTKKEEQVLELQSNISELEIENNELKAKIPKETEFKVNPENYTWKPGQSVRLHTTLANFSKDTEYIQLYLQFLETLNIQDYDDEDEQVKHIVRKVQEWINSDSDDYDFDSESFGTTEYWLSPQEAFDYYVTEENEGDCEDVSAFLYGCIVAKLTEKELWETNKERLKRVDVLIMGSGGHALLAWKKNNGVWSPIESTFGESRFYNLWRYDKDIFKSIYIDIWHIFDEEREYKLK